MNTALERELAARVSRGMAAKGWTQKRLATEAVTSEKHLSMILNNRATASVAMWDRLLELTGPASVGDPESRQIIEYALQLRMYGERAPGGDETWRKFDQMAEHYLRDLPVQDTGFRIPGSGISPVVELRRKMEHYYRAAIATEREVIDTLAPVLGYEPYPPGSPGYSEDQVNWAVGDHVTASIAFEAAARIEKLEELLQVIEDFQAITSQEEE